MGGLMYEHWTAALKCLMLQFSLFIVTSSKHKCEKLDRISLLVKNSFSQQLFLKSKCQKTLTDSRAKEICCVHSFHQNLVIWVTSIDCQRNIDKYLLEILLSYAIWWKWVAWTSNCYTFMSSEKWCYNEDMSGLLSCRHGNIVKVKTKGR